MNEIKECEKFKDCTVKLLQEFKTIYDGENGKLPYHINLIDELHANENAHSRILEKLLNQKTHNGKFEILESFIDYLKEKGGDSFNTISIENPQITQEKERIDLWIRDENYAIIIENKIHWASDQEAQIERYIETTKNYNYKEKQIFVIYLPPTYEKEPENQSWGKYLNSDIRNERYLTLSFRIDILLWLKEKVLPNTKIKEVYLRSAIEQYIDHLEGIFSLRTINNKMNMELQEFLKKELKLGLQVKDADKDIKTLLAKKEELQNAIGQIDFLEKEVKLTCLQAWEEQLKKEFSDYKIDGNLSHPDNYPQVGLKFSIDGKDFSVLIEYEGSDIYYGIHYPSTTPSDELVKKLDELNIPFNRKSNWWYGYNSTSFENGYNDLKNLINEIIGKWHL